MKKIRVLKKIVAMAFFSGIILGINFSYATELTLIEETKTKTVVNNIENNYEYEYDKNGNLIRENYYKNGEIFSYETYEYDEKNNRIKENLYCSKGNLKACYIYEYNINGKLLKDSRYVNGKLSDYMVYEYNVNGDLLDCKIYFIKDDKEVLMEGFILR
ncbi:hypothetical protein AN639_12030 [Candidatus Epulonipiscium fishelsonii]|uniref:Uncharacterized protein n=1 Tax=Candidatus Epulonipiscium fishelsonii TaxID=77094 RepID=A0ACC8XCQ0_9FIRM|nr:hypothetical protein AN396_06075 [Epulopiscium sp. SCG-B11WGA-EpuloA1]ONI42733.1 hypothetical protein AN639_12030 [Epulopiscium sp. SCG-B05WGA-EpuloA1]